VSSDIVKNPNFKLTRRIRGWQKRNLIEVNLM